MRFVSLCLVLSVLSLGCNPAEMARRRAAERNLKQVGAALQNYRERQAALDVDAWRVIAAETEYYLDGPQQGRPADGTFAASVKVKVIEEAGSYVRVRSESGIEAYVPAAALEP